MIKTARRVKPVQPGTRVDPTVVREPVKIKPPCLACVSRSRVAKHTHGTQS